MSGEVVAMVMPSDDRVWLESESVIEWLRRMEAKQAARANSAVLREEALTALTAADVIRQVRESVLLYQMQVSMARRE